jgi:tRNA dimethylallyltransferase
MKKKLKQKFIIIIFGPTAVGKSSFAEKLARKIPSQIINCDIGQFYTPLRIGTAKPDWRSSDIIQHLFDIIDKPEYFDVCQYRKMLFDQVEKIWQRNQIPILVGGSGFYLKSLFFPPVDSQMLEIQGKKYKEVSSFGLWDILNNIDPERAAKINKNDIYRIRRALHIWERTGKKPSACIPVFDFPSNFLFLFLTRDRKELYDRINKRVLQMFEEGWLEEVESLVGTEWETFLIEKKIIGYDNIIQYLHGSKGKDDLKNIMEKIQKRTRHYAKRQITFWRSLENQLCVALKKIKSKKKNDVAVESKIDSINLTLLDHDLYIKKLLNYLKPLNPASPTRERGD